MAVKSKIHPLVLEVIRLKNKLMKAGIMASAHYMDDVQTMIGWELAGDTEKGRKTIEARRYGTNG